MPEPTDFPDDLEPYLNAFQVDIAALMGELESGTITPPAWRARFGELLATYILVGYFAGSANNTGPRIPGATGGTRPGAAADLQGEPRAWVGDWLGRQLDYLNNWLDAIKTNYSAGGEYVPGWTARGQMYAASVVAPYWYGETQGLPLPALPGDGSSACGQLDACGWIINWIDRAKGDADCVWKLNYTRVVLTEHCQQCKERAVKWNPLQVRDWRLVIPVER